MQDPLPIFFSLFLVMGSIGLGYLSGKRKTQRYWIDYTWQMQRDWDAERARRRRRPSRPRESPRVDRAPRRDLPFAGFQRYMRRSQKWVIHEDRDEWEMPMLLVRVPVHSGEDVHAVLVHDATSGAPLYLRVPPRFRNCKSAVAWTFRKRASDYNPAQST